MCFSTVWNEIFEGVRRNSSDLQTEWYIYVMSQIPVKEKLTVVRDRGK
jgi:hypothetical protein